MPEELCIGGTNDGKRISVPDHRHSIELLEKRHDLVNDINAPFDPRDLSFEQETYLADQWHIDGQYLRTWRHSGISPAQSFGLLLQKYPSEEAPRQRRKVQLQWELLRDRVERELATGRLSLDARILAIEMRELLKRMPLASVDGH